MWGYELNSPQVLKKSTAGGQSQVGPGNFQLIQLGGSGAAVVRENMAGSFNTCLAGGTTIQTQTGNEAGPVAQGLNTRFGQYTGPMSGQQSTYPPDVIVDGQSPPLDAQPKNGDPAQGYDVYQGNTQITASNIDQLYNYQDYEADVANPSTYDYQPVQDGGTGAYGRRTARRASRRLQRHDQWPGLGTAARLRVFLPAAAGAAEGQRLVRLWTVHSGLRGERHAGTEPGRGQRTAHHPALSQPGKHGLMSTPLRLRPLRQRGIATIEFAICAPILLLLMLATAEVGRMLIQYNTLNKAVRDGARYAVREAADGSTGTVAITNTVRTNTQNLVVTGTMAGTGTPLLPGLTVGERYGHRCGRGLRRRVRHLHVSADARRCAADIRLCAARSPRAFRSPQPS